MTDQITWYDDPLDLRRAAIVTRPKLLTLEEFLSLPEEKPALEFIDGEVTQKAWPLVHHSVLQGESSGFINQFARPRMLARAFVELRINFAGASIVPDVSVYRKERIPHDADGRIADEFSEPPDLVVEIVSQDQSANALVRRCLWLINHGKQVALLVDPGDESVVLFRPGQLPQALRGADLIAVDEVLPGFELSVADLFASLRVE